MERADKMEHVLATMMGKLEQLSERFGGLEATVEGGAWNPNPHTHPRPSPNPNPRPNPNPNPRPNPDPNRRPNPP